MAPDMNARWQDQNVVKKDGRWSVDGYASADIINAEVI